MKSKIRRKKRISFLRIFVSSVLLAFMASLAFAFGFREYLREYMYIKIRDESSRCISDTMSRINKINSEAEDPLTQISAWLSLYTQYCIDFFGSDDYKSMLASNITENCYAVSAIIDSDNNIVVSNKEKLETIIKLDDSKTGRWYVCDREYFRACSHKNGIKNHSKHDNSQKNNIKFIITSKNFSETL